MSLRTETLELVYADVPLTVECEFDPGERAITSGPSDYWHPGCAPAAILMSAKAGPVDILPLLDADTIASIESAIVVKLEG